MKEETETLIIPMEFTIRKTRNGYTAMLGNAGTLYDDCGINSEINPIMPKNKRRK